MANAAVVDYYSILNLPADADLQGIETAYARISDELVSLSRVDPAHADALKQVNVAYAVLSNPALRRDYDAVFLAREREEAARRQRAQERRQELRMRLVMGALGFVVVCQAMTLGYVAREPLGAVAGAVFGPLVPGPAN